MLGLAHRAMLLAPAEDAFGHTVTSGFLAGLAGAFGPAGEPTPRGAALAVCPD